MYEKKIITREDSTQYVMCIRVGKDVVEFTEDQLRKQRAIDEFGTSA